MKYRDPITGNFKEVFIKVSDTLPVGSICQYAGSTAPSGYLMCNGQAVSRTIYADLFKAIGTSFGAGDGVTTFNVPNFNGRVPVGLDGTDTDFDTIGKTGGSKYLQEHSHNLTLVKSRAFPLNSGAGDVAGPSGFSEDNSGVMTNTSGIQNAGTGDSGNLQPYTVTNFIIKASKKVALDKGNVVDSLDGSDTDSAPSVRAVNEALVETYSTDEVKTNKVWIDGKPIYKKTIKKDNLLMTGDTNIAHGISNLETPVNMTYWLYSSDLGWFKEWNDGTQNNIKINSTNIVITVTGTYTFTNVYIILEYTKTTD